MTDIKTKKSSIDVSKKHLSNKYSWKLRFDRLCLFQTLKHSWGVVLKIDKGGGS